MRRAILPSTLLAIVLCTGVALADAPKPPPRPPPPPNPYPMSADSFRGIVDKMVDGARTACAKIADCPKAYIESSITQLKMRTLEACRDGVVTQNEAKWVFQARPTIPLPAPPPPRPGPEPEDD